MSDMNPVDTMEAPASDTAAEGAKRSKVLLVGLVVLALAVVAGGYFFLFSGSDDTSDDLGALPQQPNPTSTQGGDKGDKQDSGADKGDDSDKLPKQDDTQLGTVNPFHPLAAEQPVVEAPVTDTGTTDTSSTTPDTTGTADTSGATDTTGGTTSTQTSWSLMLKDVQVAKQQAVIVVDGKKHTVKVQGMFPDASSGPFQLTTVGTNDKGYGTATVVFGSSAPMEMVVGGELTVSMLS